MHVEVDLVDEDLGDVAIIKYITHVISNLLNETENQFLVDGGCENAICPIVEYQRNKIYKSTLVSQLNEKPFLSKDKQKHVRKSMYFNNSDVYLTTASSSSTCLLGLGNDCGVYFVEEDNNQAGSK